MRSKTYDERQKERATWRPWFSWYPCTTPEGVTVWLEWVWRRWGKTGYDGDQYQEYKLREDK